MEAIDSAFTKYAPEKSIEIMSKQSSSISLTRPSIGDAHTQQTRCQSDNGSYLIKNNLVNSCIKNKIKEEFEKTPIMYLFEAHEIMSKCSSSPKSSKKERGNQSPRS